MWSLVFSDHQGASKDTSSHDCHLACNTETHEETEQDLIKQVILETWPSNHRMSV